MFVLRNIKIVMKYLPVGLLFLVYFLVSCNVSKVSSAKHRYYDAHGHLSFYGENSMDSLIKYNIYGVRDCGGDLTELKKMRGDINLNNKRGLKLFISGPFLDGPKKAPFRLTITTPEQARHAVDSLYDAGVDFIKTHNALSRECYFAIIKEARSRGLKVVSHLPKGVAVWDAANAGTSCIEHVAESILASPIYAGYTKNVEEAGEWWLTSPVADSILKIMAQQKLFLTPTLIAFRTFIDMADTDFAKKERLKGFETLKKIVLKFHKTGIIILAGSDFSKPEFNIIPGKSLLEEINLLQEAGLSKREAINAASLNFELWLKSASK